MPNWKKLITSGSSAELSGLKLTDLSAQETENTTLVINSSGVIGTREDTPGSGTPLSLSVIGSNPNANSATLTDNTLNLQPASINFGGVVTTGSQCFAGEKTFTSDLVINGINVGKGLAGNAVNTNTLFGKNAGQAATASNAGGNVAIGCEAMCNNLSGYRNTAVGNRALFSSTTSCCQTAIGFTALYSNTTGCFNTAIGKQTMYSNTTGNEGTAVGANAMLQSTTGACNTAVGSAALLLNTAGSFNTAVGTRALRNSTQNGNTAIGYCAIGHKDGGSNNTSLGKLAGTYIANGTTCNLNFNNSVYIGSESKPLANNQNNQIVIGFQAIGQGSNTVTIGNPSITKTQLRGEILGSKLTIGPSHTNTSACSTIVGGCQNTLTDSSFSIIGGGNQNCIDGTISYNSLLGGFCNKIVGSANGYHSLGGGRSNQINTPGTGCQTNTLSGGYNNSIMGPDNATIGGGCGNYLSGKGATIAGGISSLAWGDRSFIGGGYNNRTLCDYSIVVGGSCNYAYGYISNILGGQSNRICGSVSTISGGDQNFNTGCLNFIGGGFQNKIGCNTSSNGFSNCISTIVGGSGNYIDGGGSLNTCYGNFIGGGNGNTIRYSKLSSILGGYNNSVSHNCSQIIGNSLQTTAVNYTFMNNVCVQGTTRTTSLVETSARKHKECITPLQDQIENIKKLEPVNFQWKEGKNQDIGFIAEEVKAVYPNLVSYEEDGEIHGVHYSKLTTVLVKALQQQQTQIDELRIELNILKNK